LNPNYYYHMEESISSKMRAFGPIPSRRLGKSLGINHVPPKVCTYSCVYCQLGRTDKMGCERREFYPPDEVVRDVEEQVRRAREKGERIDYLTFVPDGEPTLDVNLGEEIELLKPLGIRTAVISNASLMWMEDVREDLLDADWVSIKVDAVTDDVWRSVDRPHGKLRIEAVLDGMRDFAEIFEGELMTETMLIKGQNDDEEEAERVASFIEELSPDKAYVAIPTRPPAEGWVEPPEEEAVNRAYQILDGKLWHVEYLIGYEGNAFAFTGNLEEDLLSITSVHPMREEGVEGLLSRAGSDWGVVDRLLEEEKLVELEHLGKKFYMRKLPGRTG
jgi:wyosine [tRNA(Phe)-imidazoG37] synthetase (radical SAM superfamily)